MKLSLHSRHYLVLYPLLATLLSLTACDDTDMSIVKDAPPTHCCDHHPLNIDSFRFALSGERVHPESSFSVSLQMPADALIESAKMQGITMYMGTIPVLFKQIDARVWQADIMVGACSEPNMLWQLDVRVSHRGQVQTLAYPINVTHP
ncbi:hypothetical protein [Pseudoalteromonas sp. BDTF-M6]|uniref:hypothetical protein n=1 Tax=Pseudoalteromonas sp. BDTF-M6 TaxID=2796132 RepID=UPI001BB00B81|nr:hypothetical protein [Pseudoalteromonas sp. BDTF-M6]MBS3796902.1 hypothetical protein [Pseudoalteromonas sp. BDTF-M6]